MFVENPSDGSRTEFELEFPYLILEWMDISMVEMLSRRDELEWHERLSLVRQIAHGVHQMHLREVFHRDLKCDNVLVSVGRRSSYIVKVADLGRSRDFRSSPLIPEEHYAFGRGNFLHAPPECLWGLGSGNSLASFRRYDLYLLGSVLFELATGVSITSVVYPRPKEIMSNVEPLSLDERRIQYGDAANIVRSHFAPAFTMFEDELPSWIRKEGSQLMRQLCDPRPEQRDFRSYRLRKEYRPGLAWLLTRLDVLARMCSPRSDVQRTRRQQGGAS